MNYSLPSQFLERMQLFLGDEYSSFLDCYKHPSQVALRLNTLKIEAANFNQISPWNLRPIPWCSSAFLLPEETAPAPGKHPFHAAGLYYIQEPSTLAVAEFLDPQPGERVLDLAAAPGGKATHIAALMAGSGTLVANEIHPRRVWDLAENLERFGVTNAIVLNERPEKLAHALEGYFDRVLLDAPCSGEGMFRKSELARREWSLEYVQVCARRQSGLLPLAARTVRAGGRLVYSTCTFSPEENEGIIGEFLKSHPEFRIITTSENAFFSPGRPDWLGFDVPSELRGTVRLWPHEGHGEGHFIAVLQRTYDHIERRRGISLGVQVSKPALDLLKEFWNKHMDGEIPGNLFKQQGSYLYDVPPDSPNLAGMRIIHPGRWWGILKKKRFEPSHTLALSLEPARAKRILNLAIEGDDLFAYLRGETINSVGQDGWVLICVQDFPIGWGKRVQGRLKSHYPRGLRQTWQHSQHS